jgi:hypothetical protein
VSYPDQNLALGAVADVNNDGIPDIVTVGAYNGYTVLLGKGDGTFTSQGQSGGPGLDYVVGLTLGDFNGDGNIDMAVAFYDYFNVLLGSGNGSFQSSATYQGGLYIDSMVSADFNGDGIPDIATAGVGVPNTGIDVYYGSPGGIFQSPVNYSLAPSQVAGVTAVGDFNGAGSPDLAVVTYGGISVLLGSTNCLSAVQPQSIGVGEPGGSQLLTITTIGQSCQWTLTPSAPWIGLSATSGTGNGSVTVTIPPFTPIGADLTGSITIASGTQGNASVSVAQRFTSQVFTDVPPSAYYFDAVNLMSAQQITSGCAASLYCPTEDVTRAEMAIFIVRTVMGGDNFTYTQAPWFSDVPAGAFGFQWIQKLKDLGITSGCAPTLFCPGDSVTRAQMAIFIICARYGAAAQFDYTQAPYFTDVPPARLVMPGFSA